VLNLKEKATRLWFSYFQTAPKTKTSIWYVKYDNWRCRYMITMLKDRVQVSI